MPTARALIKDLAQEEKQAEVYSRHEQNHQGASQTFRNF
jgi:hypothetical protein